ncbi:MAG TPA: hypothetical protein VNR60_08420 [Croceibacterium sp.]|nr:hypothetical protein [Croceibacterium sp.]
MRKVSCWTAAAALLISPAAQAQEAAEFTPSSVWAADYGDDYCRLVRSFSNGQEEITFILQRVQPGADTQVIVIGDSLRTFRGSTELGWQFLPNQSERKSRYSRSQIDGGQQYLRLDNVMLSPPAGGGGFGPPPPYDRTGEKNLAKGLTGFAVTSGLTKPVRVSTGALDAPVGALQTCTDDLLTSWGLDAEKHKTLSSSVIAPPAPGWLPSGTIPFSEFSKFAGGGNQVRMMVGADGKPTACHIFSPSLSEALNKKICDLLMENATFAPAKDASGQAIASYWMGSPMFLGPPMGGGGRR